MRTLEHSPLIAFDLETTGVDPRTAEPVSYALIKDDESFVGTCKPTISIPEEASKIHGIYDHHVQKSVMATTAMYRCAVMLRWACVDDAVICGMNLCYDFTILNRYVAHVTEHLNIFDVLVIDREFDRFRKGSRKLTDLAKHYDVKLENAHTAEADARVCIEIARVQIKEYKLSEVYADELTRAQEVMYEKWITSYSYWREMNGQEPIPKSDRGWPVK